MNFRLWLPQLDANDAFRRMLLILIRFNYPISAERLYIYDFYLSNPPLLHKTKMPVQIRREFVKLGIKRPENSFLNYPPTPILFAKMAGLQKAAFHNIVGREFIDIRTLQTGGIVLSVSGKNFIRRSENVPIDSREMAVVEFICNSFAQIGIDGLEGLQAATGLRRTSL